MDINFQEILENSFIKSIIIPVLFTFASALLEVTSVLVKGKSTGKHCYRIWIKQQAGSNLTIAIPNQSIDQIVSQQDIVEIEQMVNLDVTDFRSLGINLILAAFSADIASLIGKPSNYRMTGFILFGHLLLLIGVIFNTIFAQLVPPEDKDGRKRYIYVSIALGLVAMITAFFSI